jgi:hypothetical protein
MAFSKERLSVVTNSLKAGVVPSLWSYYNEDGDSVIAANYFNEARLTVGDLIMVYEGGVTGSKLYRVSAKSTNTFTATVVAHAAQILNASASEILTTGTTLYQTVSIANPVSLLVTSAANTTATFTTSATAENFITLSKDVADGIPVVLTTATTLPAGLELATTYYTVNSGGSISSGLSSKKCQLSLTRGGAPVAITGAGVGVHTATVQKNIFKLADGYNNQRKIIKVKTDGGIDAVILPDNLAGGTIITAGDVNDAMELIFVEDEWHLVKNLGVAIS